MGFASSGVLEMISPRMPGVTKCRQEQSMLVTKQLGFLKLDGMVMKSQTKLNKSCFGFLTHLPALGHLEKSGSPISFASQYLPTGLWERTEAKRSHKGWALKEGKLGFWSHPCKP